MTRPDPDRLSFTDAALVCCAQREIRSSQVALAVRWGRRLPLGDGEAIYYLDRMTAHVAGLRGCSVYAAVGVAAVVAEPDLRVLHVYWSDDDLMRRHFLAPPT